ESQPLHDAEGGAEQQDGHHRAEDARDPAPRFRRRPSPLVRHGPTPSPRPVSYALVVAQVTWTAAEASWMCNELAPCLSNDCLPWTPYTAEPSTTSSNFAALGGRFCAPA